MNIDIGTRVKVRIPGHATMEDGEVTAVGPDSFNVGICNGQTTVFQCRVIETMADREGTPVVSNR